MCASFQPTRLPGYSKEEVLAEIRRVARDEFAGRAPTSIEFDKSSARVSRNTVYALLGTWPEAMKQAGLAYADKSASNADLVSDLRNALVANNGQFFTRGFYRLTGGRCHPGTIMLRFGCKTWALLLQQVLGVSPIPREEKPMLVRAPEATRATPSEEQLFEEMRRVWDSLGRQPTYGEFPNLSRIKRSVYCRVFGGWPSAILMFCTSNIGYRPSANCRQHASQSEVLADMKKVFTQNPKASFLHKTYKNSGGLYSLKTIRHHFKGWSQALQHLGIDKHRSEQRFSDEEIFIEIQKAWESLGRQPKYSEMKAPFSAMSAETIKQRFSGFTKAIHAFCADRQKSDEKGEDASSLPEGPAILGQAPSQQPDAMVFAEATVEAIVSKRRTPRDPGWRLRHQVFVRDQFRCRYCGRSPATHLGLTLQPDHIIPYTKGGETVLENLQLLCQECNGGKSDSMPPIVES